MPTGRFAPSPSADLHFGNLRTALLAWLFAHRDDATYLVRVEDLTTSVGSDPDIVARQLSTLDRLGLGSEGPVLRQSERTGRYDEVLRALSDAGLVYECFCTRAEIAAEIARSVTAPHGPTMSGAYPGTCRHLGTRERDRRRSARAPCLRLAADGARRQVSDRLCGTIERVVDDFVVRRGDGVAAYNLAVVVDDADQGIREVVRGDDLWETTPRQALLYDLLGRDEPAWVHVPLVVGPDGERLAKRDGATLDVAASGPERVVSWLGESLGLAERGEPVTLADLAERFDPDAVPREPWRWAGRPSGVRPGSDVDPPR